MESNEANEVRGQRAGLSDMGPPLGIPSRRVDSGPIGYSFSFNSSARQPSTPGGARPPPVAPPKEPSNDLLPSPKFRRRRVRIAPGSLRGVLPTKQIKTEADIDFWLNCEAFARLMDFVVSCNESVKNKRIRDAAASSQARQIFTLQGGRMNKFADGFASTFRRPRIWSQCFKL
jgi:hypothetical protein